MCAPVPLPVNWRTVPHLACTLSTAICTAPGTLALVLLRFPHSLCAEAGFCWALKSSSRFPRRTAGADEGGADVCRTNVAMICYGPLIL